MEDQIDRYRKHEGDMEIIPTEQELALPLWLVLGGWGALGLLLVTVIGLVMRRQK